MKVVPFGVQKVMGRDTVEHSYIPQEPLLLSWLLEAIYIDNVDNKWNKLKFNGTKPINV